MATTQPEPLYRILYLDHGRAGWAAWEWWSVARPWAATIRILRSRACPSVSTPLRVERV